MNNNPVELNAPEPNVHHEEVLEVYKGPGIFSNKIYLGLDGHNVRITFCEELKERNLIVFRAAIVMPVEGLTNIANLMNQISAVHYNNLQKMVQDQQAKQAAANKHMAENMKTGE